MAIPEGNHACSLPVMAQNSSQFAAQFCRVSAHQYIRADCSCYRPLRVLAHGQAWYTEIGCLFLNSSGIRDHHRRMFLEGQEIQIGQWLQKANVTIAFGTKTEAGNFLSRPRMNRKNHFETMANPFQAR